MALARRLMRQTGTFKGWAENADDDAGRQLVLQMALDEAHTYLEFYLGDGRQAHFHQLRRLRESSDLVVDATQTVNAIADQVVEAVRREPRRALPR